MAYYYKFSELVITDTWQKTNIIQIVFVKINYLLNAYECSHFFRLPIVGQSFEEPAWNTYVNENIKKG